LTKNHRTAKALKNTIIEADDIIRHWHALSTHGFCFCFLGVPRSGGQDSRPQPHRVPNTMQGGSRSRGLRQPAASSEGKPSQEGW